MERYVFLFLLLVFFGSCISFWLVLQKSIFMKFAVAGAGFSGAIIAHFLSKNGYSVDLYEARNHVAGNCFSERDPSTGILVHRYGPHIFHTNDSEVWKFVNQFSNFIPYVNRVKSTTGNKVYSLPINLHTINQFFGSSFSPTEAKNFISKRAVNFNHEPNSFEEQALAFVGQELYDTFFKEYTIKQWGVHPKELPASILKRLPLRFNYDDNYFNHSFQGMPEDGYTPIIEKLLDLKDINIFLNQKLEKTMLSDYDHVFYTGPIDAWFDFKLGRLGYRSLEFKQEVFDGDFQGCAVMNYPELEIPYTRITEHKHFAPWENHSKTLIFKEFSKECGKDDIPYYPIRLVKEKDLLAKYIEIANQEEKVSFLGRLGTYRYLDMDVTIKEALEASNQTLDCIKGGFEIPTFFVDPL